jgi:triacylglycerol lipase
MSMGTIARAPGRERRRHDGQARPFIWREALWALDWLSLRLSPVYLGLGVPRGDGSPVVLVPGFLLMDAYLLEIYFWLRRIGYSPFLSGVGVNVDCIEALTRWLENTVVDVHAETGRPVRLIGHSLGGFLARRVAVRRPDIVSQLISLGAPIRSLEAHWLVMATARFLSKGVERLRHGERDDGRGSDVYHSERCERLADVRRVPCPPPSVQRAALYTRTDGVIPWRNCLEPEAHLNHEVGGTHVGLVFNPRVYRVVARLLAEASAESRRAA